MLAFTFITEKKVFYHNYTWYHSTENSRCIAETLFPSILYRWFCELQQQSRWTHHSRWTLQCRLSWEPWGFSLSPGKKSEQGGFQSGTCAQGTYTHCMLLEMNNTISSLSITTQWLDLDLSLALHYSLLNRVLFNIPTLFQVSCSLPRLIERDAVIATFWFVCYINITKKRNLCSCTGIISP